MSGRKEARSIARAAEQAGLSVGVNGRGHYEVRDPAKGGDIVLTFSATPSSQNFRTQVEADMKRAGLFDRIFNGKSKEGDKVEAAVVEKPAAPPVDEMAYQRSHKQRVQHVRSLVEGVIPMLDNQHGSGGAQRFAEKMVETSGDASPANPASAVSILWELRNKERASEHILNVIEQTVKFFTTPEAETWLTNRNQELAQAEKPAKKATPKASPVETRYRCGKCGKEFPTKQGLGGHTTYCGKTKEEKRAMMAAKQPKKDRPADQQISHQGPLYRDTAKALRDDLRKVIEVFGFTRLVTTSMREAATQGMRVSANAASANASLRRLMTGTVVDWWVLDMFRVGVTHLLQQEAPETTPVEVAIAQMVETKEEPMPEVTVTETAQVIDMAFDTIQDLIQKGLDVETAIEIGRTLLNKKLLGG